jgi:hypothetical protein
MNLLANREGSKTTERQGLYGEAEGKRWMSVNLYIWSRMFLTKTNRVTPAIEALLRARVVA